MLVFIYKQTTKLFIKIKYNLLLITFIIIKLERKKIIKHGSEIEDGGFII